MPAQNQTPSTDAKRKLWSIIDDFRFCMFTTQGLDRSMHVRPMSFALRKAEEDIVMLADADGVKDDEIKKNPHVLLTFSDGSGKFARVNGKAQLSYDRELIKSQWSVGAKAFWPEGPDDPNIFAIIIEPESGEYWDADGGLLAGIKFAYAVATGSKPEPGKTAKVAL